MSAWETQSVLPPHVLVQKTVSLEMAGCLLLWTNVGEQEQTLEQRRMVAEALGLPRRAAKQCSTNPATCKPEQEFAMFPGMVSPFLSPLHPTRLAAVVQIPWSADWEAHGYAPHLRWIEVGDHHPLPCEREQAA